MEQIAFEWAKAGEGVDILVPKSESKAVSGGLKYDAAKPGMELLDPYALEQLAKVVDYGATKYDKFNWKKGIQWGRTLGAVLRHTFAYINGEDNDPETGLNHMAHAMANCMFLVWFSQNRKEYDDRYRDAATNTSGNGSSAVSGLSGEARVGRGEEKSKRLPNVF